MKSLSTEPFRCSTDAPRPASCPLPPGGMLWFVDLTVSDSSFMLPIVGTLCTYTGLELAKMKGATGWIKVRSFICSLVRSFAFLYVILVRSRHLLGARTPIASSVKCRAFSSQEPTTRCRWFLVFTVHSRARSWGRNCYC